MKKLKTWTLAVAVWLGVAPATARADTLSITYFLAEYIGGTAAAFIASNYVAIILTLYPAVGVAGCRRSSRARSSAEASR